MKVIDDLLDQWMEEPIKQMNLLNKLIPQLISMFDQSGDKRATVKAVIGTIENVRDVLEERGILKAKEYAAILHQQEISQQ